MTRTGGSLSFIHCADLHLDSPFQGIARTDAALAERLREAPLRALDGIIDLAIRERVDLILFAGDVFDSKVRSPRSRLAFRDALRRAAAAGISSFVAHGNHDHLGTGMGIPLRSDDMGDMVHIFGPEPETVDLLREGELIARVTGVSHDRDRLSDNLASRLRGTPGAFNIALLHCNIGSVSSILPYAPCELGDLMDKGIDYWALGHIHKRQVLAEDPYVVYPGNTQGRHVNEAEPKGVYLVRVRRERVEELEFHPVDSVRWERRELDASGFEYEDELVEEVRRQRPAMLTLQRLRLVGRTSLDGALRSPGKLEELRELMAGDRLRMESIELMTRPPMDLEERRRGKDLLAETLRQADLLRAGGAAAVLETALGRATPIQVRRLRPLLGSLDEEEVEALLSDAELWCADAMLEGD